MHGRCLQAALHATNSAAVFRLATIQAVTPTPLYASVKSKRQEMAPLKNSQNLTIEADTGS
jgi:hypothetical protein